MKKKVLIIDNDLKACRQIKYALQNITTDVYYTVSVRAYGPDNKGVSAGWENCQSRCYYC